MARALSRKNLWETLPPSLKGGIGRVFGVVPAPYLLGRRFRRQLAFVRDAQDWPARRAEAYQLAQLRHICRLAFSRTAYYRRTFERNGFHPDHLRSLDDMTACPTIDKHTLREHLDDMAAAAPGSPGIDRVSTGGSSGEPLRFYIGSDRSAVEYAYLVSSWARVGYRLDLPQAVFRGQIVPPNRGGLRHSYDPILRRHYYSNFHMTDENIRRYLEHIGTIGPCFLHVYPSSAATIARYCERKGERPPGNIRGILAGSETVFPDDRRLVEAIFGVRYFSWYGHSEKAVFASECEHASHYHVWPTYGFFELLDPNGQRVTQPGKRGEIVGTSFINTVVPFIRYRTGDYARYVADGCESCGREHLVFTEIEGRWPGGCIIARDGSAISLTAFNVHDDTFEHTLGYQFFQSMPGRAVLRIVPAKPLTGAQRAHILEGASRRLQGQVALTLEICESLERTPRGKQLRVVSTLARGDGPPSDVGATPAGKAENAPNGTVR